MTEAIEIRGMTVQVAHQVLFRDLTLRVSKGRKVLISGPSGSGKSTFLKCLLGFTQPSSGRILIEGTELSAATVWRLRRSLAYVAQEPDLGTGTVQEILERPYAYHANSAMRRQLEQVPERLAQFHLAQDILVKDITDLSGGEKQRIALISAILLDRSICFLDEVTSALDRSCRQAVLDVFLGSEDKTVLLVSHDPDVQQRVDQVVDLGVFSERT
jgi:putative ABC transport system ATP-binding protein